MVKLNNCYNCANKLYTLNFQAFVIANIPLSVTANEVLEKLDFIALLPNDEAQEEKRPNQPFFLPKRPMDKQTIFLSL